MFVNRCQNCLASSQVLNYCTRVPLLISNLVSNSLPPSCGENVYCNHHQHFNRDPKDKVG